MKLDGKRILITGADGFIGSHLTERLVRRGCDVRAFVQYNSLGSWGWLDGVRPTSSVTSTSSPATFAIRTAFEPP